MGRNKIEKQFKEQLNSREIQPSAMAWEKLDAMLSGAVEKPKRNFRWMYVAASVLGFLFFGAYYFSQNKGEVITPEVAFAVNEPKVIHETKVIQPKKKDIPKTVEANKHIEMKLIKVKSNADSNIVLSNKENQIAEKEPIQKEQISIISQKTEQPAELQKPKYISADELLASVDNAPQKKDPILPKSNVKVNSGELLTQIDGELDLTFREKAIKMVNQKVKAVKVALNNRNSE